MILTRTTEAPHHGECGASAEGGDDVDEKGEPFLSAMQRPTINLESHKS